MLACLGAIISRSAPTVGQAPVLEMLGTTSLFLSSIVGAVVSGFNVDTTVWQLHLSFFSTWLEILMCLCEYILSGMPIHNEIVQK